MPFTPEISIPTLRNLYDQYRATIWRPYGFADAFNLKANWWGADDIGIDQGPIALMIENYRTGSLWSRTMAAAEIQRGLSAAGFTTVVSVPGGHQNGLLQWALEQNYPNPFNPATLIRYSVGGTGGQGPPAGRVRLVVYDLLGREVAVLVNEPKTPGRYEVKFDGTGLASGVYLYRLSAGIYAESRKLLLVH
jgi:hypothetical protein